MIAPLIRKYLSRQGSVGDAVTVLVAVAVVVAVIVLLMD